MGLSLMSLTNEPEPATPPQALPASNIVGLHRCKICGTAWLLWPDVFHGGGWNLLDKCQRPGACCDNVAMGEQIEHLRDLPLNPPAPIRPMEAPPPALLAMQQEQDSWKQRYENLLEHWQSGRESVYTALGVSEHGEHAHNYALKAVKGLQERVKFTEGYESLQFKSAEHEAALLALVTRWEAEAKDADSHTQADLEQCADELQAELEKRAQP